MNEIKAPEWVEDRAFQGELAQALRRLVCVVGPVASGCATVLELTQRAEMALRDGQPPPLAEHQLQALRDLCHTASQMAASASREAADVLASL